MWCVKCINKLKLKEIIYTPKRKQSSEHCFLFSLIFLDLFCFRIIVYTSEYLSKCSVLSVHCYSTCTRQTHNYKARKHISHPVFVSQELNGSVAWQTIHIFRGSLMNNETPSISDTAIVCWEVEADDIVATARRSDIHPRAHLDQTL